MSVDPQTRDQADDMPDAAEMRNRAWILSESEKYLANPAYVLTPGYSIVSALHRRVVALEATDKPWTFTINEIRNMADRFPDRDDFLRNLDEISERNIAERKARPVVSSTQVTPEATGHLLDYANGHHPMLGAQVTPEGDSQ